MKLDVISATPDINSPTLASNTADGEGHAHPEVRGLSSSTDIFTLEVVGWARQLAQPSQWRPLLPDILAKAGQATGAVRTAWLEIETPSQPTQPEPVYSQQPRTSGWTARLRHEWRASGKTDSQHLNGHEPLFSDTVSGAPDERWTVSLAAGRTWCHEMLGQTIGPDGGLPFHSDLLLNGDLPQDGVAREAAAREAFEDGGARGCVLLVPVLVGKELRGLLLIETPWRAPKDEVEGWESLAALLGGAWERDILRVEVEAARADQEDCEEEVRSGERKFRALIESTGDLICTVDAQGTILYASPSVERALGLRSRPVGISLWEFVHEEDSESSRERLRQVLAQPQVLAERNDSSDSSKGGTKEPGEEEAWEMRLRYRDNTWHTFEFWGRNLMGEPSVQGVVLTARDVSGRKQAEAGLLRAALHDRLTGLPNRALLMDRLRNRVERSKRERFRRAISAPSGSSDSFEVPEGENREGMFAVLFLDFDRFKVINDSLGHMVGDELLKAAALRIEGCIRPGDTVARLGGDEFALLLEEISAQADAVQVAERVQKALSRVFSLQRTEERGPDGAPHHSTHDVFIAASIGITIGAGEPFGVPYENAGDVLRDADMAMYRAKERGRARHEIFTSRMHEQALARLQIETDLRRSLENGDFRVHYQPIMALGSGHLSGFEALVRWHHPRRGLVEPADFLGVAEETGLIAPLGWWVLRHACAQMRSWMDALLPQTDPALGALTMNVNLSSRQFASEELPDRVRQVLAESRLSPQNLKLEITEATLIMQSAIASQQLSALHEIGVQLGLDDFGTGYSSLSYLHRFSIDSLKIDRSFVSGLDSLHNAEHNASIVSSIINLARQLNLNVVAEGVETPAQALCLRQMQCPMGQGFYFSQPLPHQAAAIFLSGSHQPGPTFHA